MILKSGVVIILVSELANFITTIFGINFNSYLSRPLNILTTHISNKFKFIPSRMQEKDMCMRNIAVYIKQHYDYKIVEIRSQLNT